MAWELFLSLCVCAPFSLFHGEMLWAFPGHNHCYFISVQNVKAGMLFKLKHAAVAFSARFSAGDGSVKRDKYVVKEKLDLTLFPTITTLVVCFLV